MAVNYVSVKTSFKTNLEAGAKFVKVINSRCIDKYALAVRISDQCTLTEADVVAVLQAYETNMLKEFANGNSVEMFNLGTLKPCFKADFDASGKVIKSSLRLSKVRLITSNKFINEAKGYFYKYCGEVDYNKEDFEERVTRMMKFLEEKKSYITGREYAQINNCTHTTANKDLNILKQERVLSVEKIGTTYIYSINMEVTEEPETIVQTDASDEAGNLSVIKTRQSNESIITDADLYGALPQSTDSENIRSLSDMKNRSRMPKKRLSEDDKYVDMFYNLIGNKFGNNDFSFDNTDEENKILKACENVMENIASDFKIDDIYDDKVIERLDPKVFPVKMVKRNKRRMGLNNHF